jgi:drug/metabolite transporter (DMT)-like permease
MAYIAVVFIWSTTPLAIKWSGEEVGFLFGITGRMSIGVVLALVLTLIRFKSLPLTAKAFQVYSASALAIFGAMMPVYWGAQYISSGLISVVFGLTPIFTALLVARLLEEKSITFTKIAGSLLGIAGLAVVFSEQFQLGEDAVKGISAVLLSVSIHSLSAVWIKQIDSRLPALVVTTGGLLLSLPLFLLVYFAFAGPLPDVLSTRTIASIVYLGVMGSVVGFVSYYYLLSKLAASTVALVTLLTPITALWIGSVFNQEVVSQFMLLGTTLVLSGLMLHQWGHLVMKLVRSS